MVYISKCWYNNLARLTPVVSTSISVPISSISIGTVSIGISIPIGVISISTTLATDNTLEGVSSWVELADSVVSSVHSGQNRNSISVGTKTIAKITRFSISATLA